MVPCSLAHQPATCLLLPATGRVYETVLVLEYCDRGFLMQAILAGKFLNPATKEPELVGSAGWLLANFEPGSMLSHGAC
jgi:hypothetical protein